MTIRVVKVPLSGRKTDVTIALTVADATAISAAVGVNHIAYLFNNASNLDYTHNVALDTKMQQLADAVLEDSMQTIIGTGQARSHSGDVGHPKGENKTATFVSADTVLAVLNGQDCCALVYQPDPTTSGLSFVATVALRSAIKERMAI